jgi:hypothetical protein
MTPFGFIDGSDQRFPFILAALIEFFPEPTMHKFHLKNCITVDTLFCAPIFTPKAGSALFAFQVKNFYKIQRLINSMERPV